MKHSKNLVNNQLKITNSVLEEYKNKTQKKNIDNLNHLKEVKKVQQKALTNFNATFRTKERSQNSLKTII